jgi:acetyl-CoA carboxylase biotin carboxyl carrier protein
MANEGSSPGDIFDVKRVRRLVELMKEHDLAEIDLRQGEQRVRIRRGGEPLIVTSPAGYHVPAAAHTHVSPQTASTTPSSPASAADDRDMQVIKSPMVGTFYTAANPESPPFIKVGDHVGPDTVVCIIEAMKVFNEIPAEVSGQIAAVLVENNTPVEFGQPLFKVTRQ